MANQILIGVAALVVVGAAAGYYFLSDDGGGGLDSAGQSLARQAEAAATAKVPDASTCRKLLQSILSHPQRREHRALMHAEAVLHLALGNSRQAWDAISPAAGLGAAPADAWLAARIQKRRHAETGTEDLGRQAGIRAEEHFDATGELPALFLAWQMAVRIEDRDRAKELAQRFAAHADTPAGRVVACLPEYPTQVPKAAEARAELRALLDEFDPVPEEVLLANAWVEIEDIDTALTGMKRAEGVLKTFAASIYARFLISLAAIRLERWQLAEQNARWLIQNHPQHPLAKDLWPRMLVTAEAQGKAK